MRCGAYEHRPRVCRIYPAEINPLLALSPEAKLCPPEAWSGDQPLFARDGKVIDREISALSTRAQEVTVGDISAKERLCARLGINRAAVANEGFVIHRPCPARLIEELRRSREPQRPAGSTWSIASNRSAMIAMLDDAGAISERAGAGGDYIGFFADAHD
jgi:hypothetical protein